jgi:23S rRNA (uracil1939-C5)-methyltransferase
MVDVQLKKRKAYYEGKAIHFHEYSEHRIEPIYEHFGVCGGCKWHKIQPTVVHKQNEVLNHLQRIGKNFLNLNHLRFRKQFFYRNKMEFSFSSRWLTEAEIASTEDLGNRNALGFISRIRS